MADILPIFPLSLVAFPSEEVNLHIFEPRYKQLFHECAHKGIRFAIAPVFDGQDMIYATEMELVEIAKTYDDGKMDVRTKGTSLVKILEFFPNHPGKLYPGAEIERLAWDENADLVLSEKIISYLNQLYKTMRIDNVPVADVLNFRTFQNAHKVGFSEVDELTMLSMSKEVDRQKYMLKHLQKFLPMMREAEELRRKAALNGHFKNLKSKF